MCLSVTSCPLTNTQSPSDRWPVHTGSLSRRYLWRWAFLLPAYHSLHLWDYLKLLSPFPPCFPVFFLLSSSARLFPGVLFSLSFPFHFLLNLLLKHHVLVRPKSDHEKTPVQLQEQQHSPGLGTTGETKLKSSETEERWGLLWDLFYNENSAMKRNLFIFFFPLDIVWKIYT